MKKVINLKTQYSLKKLCTYRTIRPLKRLNKMSLKNSFNFFYFFKNVVFNNLKFNKFSISILKPEGGFIFLTKFQNKRFYVGLTNKNYVYNHGLCTNHLNDTAYKNIYKTDFRVSCKKMSKKKLLNSSLVYWCCFDSTNNNVHLNLFYTHQQNLVLGWVFEQQFKKSPTAPKAV
jgi:hypothetical protein